MGEDQELQLHIREQADPARSSPKEATFAQSQSSFKLRKWQWWFLLFIYSFLILAGQTSGTLLGRFYFKQGGKSLWMATIVPSSGFPLLIPLLLILRSSSTAAAAATVSRPSIAKLAAIYIGFGLIGTGDNLMYSYGLLYLPVSTFSLVCATQLAFNAVFSYFLNSQKFTPFIFNSIILLTLAAALLGVHSDSGSASDHNYPLGLALTLAASAVFSLVLSLTQLVFQKVIKAETFTVVLEMILWTGLVSSVASVVGLFAGGEWKMIHEEFTGSEKGRVSYLMTLIWIAICWLLYGVGNIGLIFLVSSLFANVIGTLGLPLVPIFAVMFFHERMDGVKAVALLMAILGFVNYVYQHYLDDTKEKRAVTRDEQP
ncbi:probable purine permease 11 isoform X1 [Dendrobium catenatum]|uniref:probable purine permease 11 isoform X1 n=1 Tax=Dendrobium catenatum TaxID=906689 RepID=UPI0009F44940|nr:probable purine permease 11 isoform X1 [Dendrobium catenatum]